ncbi:tetratricopeptide repeat protein [Streptomyces sp. NPDC003753]
MDDQPFREREREAASAELHNRLSDGLACSGLTKTQLAARAGLGRTTVHEALRLDVAAVPSAETVAALAHALRLPAGPLLELRRAATADTGPAPGQKDEGAGRPISEWDPHDLEVHPAGPAQIPNASRALRRTLPGYIRRAHDEVLADAVRDVSAGHSRMMVVVGTSSTGKTRACWEAVKPLADKGWRLWHPFDPTRAEAALDDLGRVRPYTVVWLNEAQHYIGDPRLGERVAAALHNLLTHPERRPVLILGTLWPEYAIRYTTLPEPTEPDPHTRVRELLAGRTLTIPESFDEQALRTATILAEAGDQLLADALTRARTDGRVTQDLAGAPELLLRYQRSSPAAKAVLEAAMDARRLGVGLHLPQTFLTDAAVDYLTDHDYERLTEDWAEAAFAELARPVHGKQAPLNRTGSRPKRRPPGSLEAGSELASAPGPMFRLADYLEQHSHTTRRRLCPPASFWHAAQAHITRSEELKSLSGAAEERFRLQWAHHLDHAAEKAKRIHGGEGTDFFGREYQPYQRARGANHPYSWADLARNRERAGDHKGAEELALRAAEAGNTIVLAWLANMRDRAGDRATANFLREKAADAGNPYALGDLARKRERDGDLKEAEALAQRADDAGNGHALRDIVRMRERAGNREGAEDLAQRAADAGHADALGDLAMMRERSGDRREAVTLAQRAAYAGKPSTLSALAKKREEAGDRESAEDLYIQAANAGDHSALCEMARIRESLGDRERAKDLYRQAADAGVARNIDHKLRRWWPYGLDPDGTPTPPWQ